MGAKGHEAILAGLQAYFQTLPDSMFTAFRCFTGECVPRFKWGHQWVSDRSQKLLDEVSHMNQSIAMIASSSIRMSQDAVVPENPYNNIQVPKGFYVDRLYLSLLYPFPTHSLNCMRGKWLTEWASEWVTEWLTHDLRSEIYHSHPSPRVFC